MHHQARKSYPYPAVSDVDDSLGQKLEALKSSIAELVDHPSLSNGSNLGEMKARIHGQISEASAALEAAQSSARDVMHEKAETIDEYVHDEPWKVAAIAAALGLAVGVALARR